MAALSASAKDVVSRLYYEEGHSMREVAGLLGVSLNALTYFMRQANLKRRSRSESRAAAFAHKLASFTVRKKRGAASGELDAIGAMLYWAEGYKTHKASGVDFANSDPLMVEMFLHFLRSRYALDESRLRVLLYCYKDQSVSEIMQFWARLTRIPITQFTKPYVRQDFREQGRKVPYGLVHIRYSDKKLLLDLRELISSQCSRYCVGGRAVKYTSL